MERNAEAELRGRLVALETLVAVMLSRLAELAPDPVATIGAVMANTEDLIEEGAKAAGADHAEAARFARAAFDALSDALQQHIAQRSMSERRN